MSDYFQEMGWQPLGEGQTPNQLLHFARLLRDFGMWEELGQNQRLPPAASRQVVENLEEKTVTCKDDKCPVCLKMCSLGETVKVLPCKHFFHPECILPWLHRTNSCPLCRHELPRDDEDYEMYRKEKLRAKQREDEIETLHNSMFS
ncbi:E3 ubiquitin-protein ligase RNF181-like [Bacillus rossius redtenbacheri]|uniref:E3 ubiquitin-protein ligase RNF181-like n=1 Tax=Bacillus rossius redtenbacheri TaxID=93214 RepID=UPI002FDE2CAA